jgi:plastocyanin
MRTTTNTEANAKHRRTGFHTAIGIIVAVVLSLVGSSVVANAAAEVSISITTTFSPANVTIQTGTTVTWTNNDSQSHELRSTSGPAEFRSSQLAPGQSASFTFASPGTYTYLDHQNDKSAAYRGTIVVTNGAPATPPPAPAPGTATPPAPATASVRLAGAQFAPTTVTVAVGGTVTWTNDDNSKHTVTADNGTFDSATLNAGATFAHTFTAAGTYAYGCDFHGNMRGTIIVTGAPGAPAPVPPVTPAPVPPTPVATPPATPVAPPAAPAPGSTVTTESVSIANNAFSPSTITVNVGSTVNWANGDTVTHTVTAAAQSFTSGLMKKTTSWSHTFAAPGTFTYFCEIHPEMTGTVIAKASDGSVPPAAAPAVNNTPAPTAVTTGTQPATSSGLTSAASTGAATGSIAISDTGFTPASFRLALGGTLTFANNGKAAHTVTANDGSFDSDMIRSTGSWVHTFNTAGSFSYHCILHPSMKGTVLVGSSGGDGNAAAPIESLTASPTVDESTTTVAGATTSAIQPVSVDVADNQFNPNVATVAAGGTVTWTLSGEAAHTMTADDQSFNSGIIKPGESFQYTFTKLGSFTYLCLIHPGMAGTINVVPPEQAAAQQAATPPPAAGSPPVQPDANQTSATVNAGPARDSGLWGDTLLGIAAVLVACCALVFALKSFLKILGSGNDDPSTATPPTDGLTPNPI